MFAGVMIAIAVVINLQCSNPIVGAFLFSLGLLSIVYHHGSLYTGMTDNWLDEWAVNKDAPWWYCLARVMGKLAQLATVLFMNFVGVCAIAGFAHYFSGGQAQEVVAAKAALPWYHLIWSGAMCGMLMLLAVRSYKLAEHYKEHLIGVVLLVMCVMAFILAGFDHSIANMAYVITAHQGGVAGVKVIMWPVLGNFVGGAVLHLALRVNCSRYF